MFRKKPRKSSKSALLEEARASRKRRDAAKARIAAKEREERKRVAAAVTIEARWRGWSIRKVTRVRLGQMLASSSGRDVACALSLLAFESPAKWLKLLTPKALRAAAAHVSSTSAHGDEELNVWKRRARAIVKAALARTSSAESVGALRLLLETSPSSFAPGQNNFLRETIM